LKLSLYPYYRDNSQKPNRVVDLQWGEVVDLLGARGWMRDPGIATKESYRDKFDVPLWSGHVLREGTRRENANVESVSIITLDFDENAAIEDVDWVFGDFHRLLHTTWQHTPQAPRCRLVLPLRRPVSAAEFEKVMEWAVAHARENGLKPDSKCYDPARFLFLPSCPPGAENTYKYIYTDSSDPLCAPLDPDSVIAKRINAGETRTSSERVTGSIVVTADDGTKVDVLEWAERTPFSPDDQKNTKVKCACPFKEGASPGSAFVRRVRTGAVVVCTSDKHGHPGSPWKWFYRLAGGEDINHELWDAPPDPSVLPLLMMKVDKHGDPTNEIVKSAGNIGKIIMEDYRFKGKLWYNAFSHTMMCGEDVLEEWVGRATIILEVAYGLSVAPDKVKAIMTEEARIREANPLVDWILALPEWDGVPRIDTWLTEVFGVEDTALHRAMGSKWLVSAIGRALRPGCKVDTMLVVSGQQGIGKSTVFRNLCPTQDEIGIGVFSDAGIDVESDNAGRIVSAAWIVEFAEFKDIRAKEVEAVKQFLTRQYDEWVPKYKEQTHRYPRHAIFCGTTNESDILVDQTGNRRFMVVLASKARADWVSLHRDQLWAEALHRYRQHTGATDPWVLTAAEDRELAISNKGFESEDALREGIIEWLYQFAAGRVISVPEVWTLALRRTGTPNAGETKRISKIMKKICGDPKQMSINGHNLRRWTLPATWETANINLDPYPTVNPEQED
jgi:predicted P-loop ATPase